MKCFVFRVLIYKLTIKMCDCNEEKHLQNAGHRQKNAIPEHLKFDFRAWLMKSINRNESIQV